MEPADLKQRLLERYPKSRLTPLSSEAADALRFRRPGLPEDYVRFLTEVGYGNIGDSRFFVYSGPIEPDDIYDEETAAALTGILLVGDNLSGYCVGYHTGSGWVLGGVGDDCTFDLMDDTGTFTAFIEDWFLRPD